ncbi:MAG: nucleotidyltransferase domain-containing protein [Bacteroidetes bacterium]|nr:nucleotidyltransferase domain-containing protein [Bacteroidota bacterium]MBU1719682.1 nucleotidyltransferase domain-containing protein [Bacteroidota bacterium]
MNLIDQYRDQIIRLCESNGVMSLYAFGSVLGDKFKADSDIDLLVEIDDADPFSYTDKYFSLKFHLEELLKRQIDLLEQKAIKNRFIQSEIDRTKVLIYGRGNKGLA